MPATSTAIQLQSIKDGNKPTPPFKRQHCFFKPAPSTVPERQPLSLPWTSRASSARPAPPTHAQGQGTAQHLLFCNAATSLPISQRAARPLPPPQMTTSRPSCFTHLPPPHCLKPPLAVKKDLNSCRLWGAAGYHCKDKNAIIIHTYVRTHRHAHTPCPHPGPCPALTPALEGPYYISDTCLLSHV